MYALIENHSSKNDNELTYFNLIMGFKWLVLILDAVDYILSTDDLDYTIGTKNSTGKLFICFCFLTLKSRDP